MQKFISVFLAALLFGPAACATTSALTRAQSEELGKTAQVEATTPQLVAKVSRPAIVIPDGWLSSILRPPDTYRVDVVCDLPTAISAGKYDWRAAEITSGRFPEVGCKPGEVEVTLVEMSSFTTIDGALRYLDFQDFRPATLPEVLALGASQPDLQRKLQIVALGSQWRRPFHSLARVPFLYGDGDGRRLGLVGHHSRHLTPHLWSWGAAPRFAAVRM